MRILLADDQPKIRFALRVLLERQPELDVVGEAAEAATLLTQLETTQPDVVLLDWELPGLSAIGGLPAVRAVCPQLVVIALSGRLEARQAALAAGADAFVSKGSPPDQLLATLRALGQANNPKSRTARPGRARERSRSISYKKETKND